MEYKFPEYYNYPFMYTLQKNQDIKDKQLKMWTDIICGYCQHSKIYQVGISELYNSKICINTQIDRRISLNFMQNLIEHMVKHGINNLGFAEYTNTSKDKVFIYFKSVQEVAKWIYEWADRTGRIGSVETIVDLSEAEENSKELFYKVPVEIIKKACDALQRESKAEVFYSEKSKEYGVKFFHM